MASILEREYKMTDSTSSIATLASYTTSVTLVVGSALDFLNHNALAFGVIFGAVTCWINYRAKRALQNYYMDTSTRKRKDDMDADA